MWYIHAVRVMDWGSFICQTPPVSGATPAERVARLFALLLVVVALTLSTTVAKADTRVLVAQTADAEMDVILAQNLTLPLLLDTPELAEQDLSREIEAEARKMSALLQAYGYLTARVEVSGSTTDADPLILTPLTGNLFRIGWIRVDGISSVAPAVKRSIEAFIDAKVGEKATTKRLDLIRAGVVSALRNGSYGHAVVPFPDVAVEPRTSTAGMSLIVQPGESLTFGNTYFTGSFRMKSAEAAAFVPYQIGEPYTGEAIEALRAALEDTNRFRKVRIKLVATPNPAGQTDIHVDLRDRAPNVIELARSSGIGPMLLILTMLMIVSMECLRVSPFWSSRALRRIVTLTSISMISVSVPVIVMRLAGFL
jgi:outer membrane translocation and assembly module TamA